VQIFACNDKKKGYVANLKHMKQNNLYFLAIVLPEELQKRIVAIEEYIAEKYNSHKSLRIIPHITLKAPFTIDSGKHEMVRDWFGNLVVQVKPFAIDLKDYGSFANKNHPVIFINPMPNKDLSSLQSGIIDQFATNFPEIGIMSHERYFHPHVTVAYRDLTPEQFLKAWEDFQKRGFLATFPVSDFHLLQHNGAKWITIDTFRLSEVNL
jgi:2'-5' RNA ligase